MVTSARASASAAKFVDSQLESAASAVERIANVITAATGDAESRLGSFGEPVGRGLDKTVAKLRSHNGEDIVDGAKKQMLQHPRATVGIAAAVGAIAAQAALMMFKNELPKNGAIRPVKAKAKNGSSVKKGSPKKQIDNDQPTVN